MAETPKNSKNPLYQLLHKERVASFNEKLVASKEKITFEGLTFRGLDLRGMEPGNTSFKNCYFRQSDLRGIDFSQSNLEGASIIGAKISGVYFPKELNASEIEMSLSHGTRMRYSK